MSTTSQFSKAIQDVLAHPRRGVVGVVDDLLTLCQNRCFELDWRDNRCRVRSGQGEWEELTKTPLQRSVFRAVLARIGALCNEHKPNSVSPYGGEGEIMSGADPPRVVHVAFANTPAEQRLELTHKEAARER